MAPAYVNTLSLVLSVAPDCHFDGSWRGIGSQPQDVVCQETLRDGWSTHGVEPSMSLMVPRVSSTRASTLSAAPSLMRAS